MKDVQGSAQIPRFRACRRALTLSFLAVALQLSCASSSEPGLRFEISFPSSLHSDPVTGRAYIVLMRTPNSQARTLRALGHQPVSSDTGEPFFAVDVDRLQPGETAVVDGSASGYPVLRLDDLPPGEYWAQAILNIYTRFERSDGHSIWARMDQWDGQRFNISPGNLISDVQRVELNPRRGGAVRLELSQELPPIEVPPDTQWVRRIKIQSDLLSEFWGHPFYFGATVLLPKDFDRRPEVRYPAVYLQGHFSLEPPFNFRTEPVEETESHRLRRLKRNRESEFEFYQSWTSDDFPRMVVVTFQHPTPFFDASYAVNSVNNGPYADALLTELIPRLENEFRLIPEGYARALTGGSTGGYQALALQVHHPPFFGGAWVFAPDPIDFRRFFKINIYEDDNAFDAPGFPLLAPQRYAVRSPDGQPLQSIQQLSRLRDALGSKGRSGEYLEAWESNFGPVDDEGYPRPLWNPETGEIDREVAHYWRDNGYDLSQYLEQNWPRIGRDLEGKLHILCGDMDDYYFNLGVYLLEERLERTRDPYYGGSFRFGRPQKGHSWRPMTNAELLREIADHISRRTPPGQSSRLWRY